MNLLFRLGIRRTRILRAKLILFGILVIILYIYLLGEMTKSTHPIPQRTITPIEQKVGTMV
jgi:hypothetical protein